MQLLTFSHLYGNVLPSGSRHTIQVRRGLQHRKASAERTLPETDEARGDLREVADCVRSLLAASNEPASLGRLYRMHKDIQRQILEIENDSDAQDFCI